MTERYLRMQAFIVLNGMAMLDERRVPAVLGGGVICRPEMQVYELRCNGRIEFVARCGLVGKGATLARQDMRDYLVRRARGDGSLPEGYRRCARCQRAFKVTHPRKKYCSSDGKTSCKYLAQLERARV